MNWIAGFSGHESMKIITVKFIAQPARRNEIISLCTGMLEPSRKEIGCVSYNFYQDITDQNSFFFFEEWKDQESIDSHNASPHFLLFVSLFEPLIIGKADINVFTI